MLSVPWSGFTQGRRRLSHAKAMMEADRGAHVEPAQWRQPLDCGVSKAGPSCEARKAPPPTLRLKRLCRLLHATLGGDTDSHVLLDRLDQVVNEVLERLVWIVEAEAPEDLANIGHHADGIVGIGV